MVERRAFIADCSLMLLAGASQCIASASAHAATERSDRKDSISPPRNPAADIRRFSRSILADEHGKPVLASALKPLTNYLFHYPFVATPCLLLNLGRSIDGGAGRSRSIVAFSAICSHKLAYPAKEVSFIRFQASASARSEAQRIHCCADHSVYDPAAGAKVVAGPAPAALAAVLLEHDVRTDALTATGISGADQFDAFFSKYAFKLNLEFAGRERQAAAAATRVQELTQFCRNVAQC